MQDENLITLHKFLFEGMWVKMHATNMRDIELTKTAVIYLTYPSMSHY